MTNLKKRAMPKLKARFAQVEKAHHVKFEKARHVQVERAHHVQFEKARHAQVDFEKKLTT